MTHRPIFEPLDSGKVVFLPDLPAEAFAPMPRDSADGRERAGEEFRQDRVRSMLATGRSEVASAFALSAPLAFSALAMGLPALLLPRVAIGALNLSYVLALLVLAAGFSVARVRGESLDVACWTSTGIAMTILIPLLAVQTEAVRAPFVGAAFGTLRPVMLLTVSVAAVLIGLAFLAAISSRGEPEHAGFVLVFSALLIPAISSVPRPVTQLAILATVAVVSSYTAVVVLVGRLVRRGLRPFVCPLAFAVLIGTLAATGRRWFFEESSAGIVRALPLTLLGIAILLVVAVPLMALYVRAIEAEMSRRAEAQT